MDKSNTLYKGDCAKAHAMSTFTQLGYKVGMLLTESAPYDLLVDTGDDVKRVSVKYLGTKKGNLDLRHIRYNSEGFIVRKTKEKDYDWLYIYDPKGKEYLYPRCIFNQSTIKPTEEFLIKNLKLEG